MTISVDTVAIDADLENELGGHQALQNLLPHGWSNAQPARQWALNDVLDDLSDRTPPIVEADISNVADIKRAVVLGAVAHLYGHNITTGDDVHAHHERRFRKMYEAKKRSTRPTSTYGERTAPGAIALHRR